MNGLLAFFIIAIFAMVVYVGVYNIRKYYNMREIYDSTTVLIEGQLHDVKIEPQPGTGGPAYIATYQYVVDEQPYNWKQTFYNKPDQTILLQYDPGDPASAMPQTTKNALTAKLIVAVLVTIILAVLILAGFSYLTPM